MARGLALAYTISTGNEAVLGIEDYVEFLIEDAATRVITFRRADPASGALPRHRRGRPRGRKPIVMLIRGVAPRRARRRSPIPARWPAITR